MHYIIRPVIPQIREPQEIDEAEYKEINHARKLAWDILLIIDKKQMILTCHE